MALTILTDLFKVQKSDGSKAHTTVTAIFALLTGTSIKSKYEGQANTNAFTDAEKAKLAGLESSKYAGVFVSIAALNAVTGAEGQ